MGIPSGMPVSFDAGSPTSLLAAPPPLGRLTIWEPVMKSQANHVSAADVKRRNSEIEDLMDVVDHLHAACSKAIFLNTAAMQAIEDEQPKKIVAATYMVYDYLHEIQGIKDLISEKFIPKVQS